MKGKPPQKVANLSSDGPYADRTRRLTLSPADMGCPSGPDERRKLGAEAILFGSIVACRAVRTQERTSNRT